MGQQAIASLSSAVGMRVLLCPLNIADDPWALSRGLRNLGVHADLATVSFNHYQHAPDIDLRFQDSGLVARAIKKMQFVNWAMRDYDLIHYQFAHSIFEYELPGAELLDLRYAARVRMPRVMTFHGCEARNALSERCTLGCPLCQPSGAKRRRLEMAIKHCQRLFVTTPDLLLDVPQASWVPQSVEAAEHSLPVPPRNDGPLRVVHAPSSRSIKGTEAVLGACQELMGEGVAIELRLIEDMLHEDALKAYEWADLAVDQLRIGWYGVFSVEMMAMAKPVICYIDPAFARLAGQDQLPMLSATERTVKQALLYAATNRDEMRRLGVRAREYAIRMHSPSKNAALYLEEYVRLTDVPTRQRPKRANV